MMLRPVLDSLKTRLLLSMLLLTLVVLPVLAIALSQAFEGHIKAAIKNELTAYSYSILAVAEPVNGEVYLPELLLENQFNVIDSGLYAVIYLNQAVHRETEKHVTNSEHITKTNEPLWRSPSALSLNFADLDLTYSTIGESSYLEKMIDGTPYFVFQYSVSFADQTTEIPITLLLIKDKTGFNQTVKRFDEQVILWLGVIFIVLLVVQLIWLFWTLKPLARFRQELSAIKQGQSSAVKGHYPHELRQVTEQLNLLLKTEQNQRVRYRNALSDLAHSLKTPLAVMQSKINGKDDIEQEIFQINKTIEHQLKRAQSAGESSWRLGCDITQVADALLQALGKIYQDKQLSFNLAVDKDAVFKGDEADLTELLGNLLDNACKAAKSKVSLSVNVEKNRVTFIVQDDGEGMSEVQMSRVLERGTRADTYEQGHGIGLAIVKDLVASYQGSIVIERSASLGGAKFVLAFNQS